MAYNDYGPAIEETIVPPHGESRKTLQKLYGRLSWRATHHGILIGRIPRVQVPEVRGEVSGG